MLRFVLTYNDSQMSEKLYRVSPSIFTRPQNSTSSTFDDLDVEFNTFDNTFGFTLHNHNQFILTTYNRTFFVSTKFIELGFKLRTKRLFGLGQKQFALTNGTYTLFAKGDSRSLQDDYDNTHIHPFVLF